jgi:hypothetical protein
VVEGHAVLAVAGMGLAGQEGAGRGQAGDDERVNELRKVTDPEQMREAFRPLGEMFQTLQENLRHFKIKGLPFPSGGIIPSPPGVSGDQIPAVLSRCQHTLRRPGETHAQAVNRLTEGEDL